MHINKIIFGDLPAPKIARKRSEHSEQHMFCQWLDTWLPQAGGRYHAVVNEGRRTRGEAVKAHQQGLRAGVPDLNIFHPAVGMIALEFKRADGTVKDVRANQRAWIDFFDADMGERFFAKAVFGCEDAKRYIRTLFGRAAP